MGTSKRYLDFVAAFAPELPRLPLMHTTKGKRFVSIMDNREIAVGRLDEHINKSVNFHFYGKPSYRPRPDEIYSSQIGSALFCLILNMEKLPQPCSILPFDSGGYKERYADHCDNIELDEFYLPVEAETPGRLVSAVYGTNYNYYMMNAREDIANDITPFDLHSAGLARLASADGPKKFDQRACSIEVHFDVPIPLESDNVLAIVAPDIACEYPELEAFASSLSAERVPYLFDLDETSVRQRQIRDAARGWLVRNNYMAAP